ncbi:MAG TPA: zf-HC2 domain-containing protein [Thermoanaerobaculia bacterium]|nr:zf-HC2 domain-containing protein [Thermoanaerobaculia bacterium]
MREREDHGERNHQRVWELLPWYVNGSLAQPERERVEAHLAACRRCEEEVRACRRTAAEIAGAGEVAPSPHPIQFQRVLARIEESEREEGRHGGGWRLLAPFRSLVQATPRPLRGALVAQAAVIFLLVGFLAWDALRPVPPAAGTSPAGSSPAVYRTLSDPAPAPVPTVRLRVMFSPKATEREIRGLLLGIRGEITAGPSPLGLYTVEVPAAGDPAAGVLARLRSEPQVVAFVEPVSGETGR